MITIEHLEILFEAERQRDQDVFARLFTQHMARHENARAAAREDALQAARDRTLEGGAA